MLSPQQDDGLEEVGVAAVDEADRYVKSFQCLRQQVAKLFYLFTTGQVEIH